MESLSFVLLFSVVMVAWVGRLAHVFTGVRQVNDSSMLPAEGRCSYASRRAFSVLYMFLSQPSGFVFSACEVIGELTQVEGDHPST